MTSPVYASLLDWLLITEDLCRTLLALQPLCMHWCKRMLCLNCQEAFDHLKKLLSTAPILAYPRFGPGVEFVLTTDESGVGLGAVQQEDGQLHPVVYASWLLDTSEKNYGISELEILGLVWAAHHFRPYIFGHCTWPWPLCLSPHCYRVHFLHGNWPGGHSQSKSLT